MPSSGEFDGFVRVDELPAVEWTSPDGMSFGANSPTVYECQRCFALVTNPQGHSATH